MEIGHTIPNHRSLDVAQSHLGQRGVQFKMKGWIPLVLPNSEIGGGL